jgi:hypothetical protein
VARLNSLCAALLRLPPKVAQAAITHTATATASSPFRPSQLTRVDSPFALDQPPAAFTYAYTQPDVSAPRRPEAQPRLDIARGPVYMDKSMVSSICGAGLPANRPHLQRKASTATRRCVPTCLGRSLRVICLTQDKATRSNLSTGDGSWGIGRQLTRPGSPHSRKPNLIPSPSAIATGSARTYLPS